MGPAGPALAVAVLALVGGAALSRRAPMPDDPLSAPLTDSPPQEPRSAAAVVRGRRPVVIAAVLIVGLTEVIRFIG